MLVFSTYLYRNLAQGMEVVAEIDQLLAKGKEELEPCQHFRNKLEKFEKAGLDSHSPSHASKEEALDVLELLETYPGTPPSHYRAAITFDKNHEMLASRLDQISLRAREAQIEGECDMFAMLRHGSLLLKDTKAFKFESHESSRVRGLLAAYLKSENPSYNMLAIAVRGALLQRLLESGQLPAKAQGDLIARTRGFLHLFEEKRRMLAEGSRKEPQWKMFLLSSRGPELAAVHELDQAYGALLKEAKI